MNKIKFFALLFVSALIISSCARHDFIDEMAITGNVGPQALWELGSSSVAAGTNADFVLQYYSTVDEISHSEVWYSVSEMVSKKVNCPWLSTFTHTYTSDVTELKRISEKIETFPHNMAEWSDSLSAYKLEAAFPVTSTLGSFSWRQPEQFGDVENENMAKYFGETFMQDYKDAILEKMQYADFQKMILGLDLDDTLKDKYGGKAFKELTDSTYDANSASYVYHFPKLGDGTTPTPQGVIDLYNNEITFGQLTQTPAGHDVEYSRSYKIDAIMRVYDTRGVYGNTISREIVIN